MLLTECAELAVPATGGRRTVIIGGGTVGLYAARELVKRGQEVVVIECGGQALGNFAPESFASVGKPHDGIRLGRARNLGGTSNLWGGQLVEFQPVDFAGRDWVPDSKWPVTYAEVAAHYERTYANLGIPREFLDDRQVFKHAGGATTDFTEGLELFLTRWLKVPSLSVAYAEEIRSHEKFKVLLNHTVVGFAGANGAITAIRIVDHAGKEHLIGGDEFILAAGTIEIARLLLHAAATPSWDCPWRNNENVGAYFQDHLVGRVAALEVLDRRRFFNTFSTIVWSGHKFQPKIRLTDQTLQSSRIMNIQAMMSFESSISENLVYLKQFVKAALYSRKFSGLGDLFRNLRACGAHLLPLMWKYVVQNRIFVPGTSKISLNIQGEQTPLKASRISIDPAVKDADGLPKAILDWRVGSEEIASIREFTLHCDRALRAAGLARLHLADWLMNLEPKFAATLHDNYHQSGGARMGETEKDGVVDRDLRVFGTTNLYVIGAASFRTTSNANVTFTALALVTRLVDRLTSGRGGSFSSR
ncbi:MAG: GMC family oxidoreductase [Verrucomicrobia bacterium]|nr:GMC family oxidoreductase [Verrucomicrobiota bacterium]